ncbi:hypothetical protein AB9P05_19565 [Roseivirga sp. BDSF3-8]|uniref:hypothetical protein n=1 Tax=Roseivirga sp. BDSF3-8 TaxID=3241598 RepID=UPI0035325792
MKYILRHIVSVVFLASLMQCTEKPATNPFTLPENAGHLVAGDSAMTWKLARRFNGDTRMNMGDCFLSYRITYRADNTMQDNNGEHSGCGPTLAGTWKFARDKSGNALP